VVVGQMDTVSLNIDYFPIKSYNSLFFQVYSPSQVGAFVLMKMKETAEGYLGMQAVIEGKGTWLTYSGRKEAWIIIRVRR
jgi:hypothetical protein